VTLQTEATQLIVLLFKTHST